MKNKILDTLYHDIKPLPTQFLLDFLMDHDCALPDKICECTAFVKELTRRMDGKADIL